MEKKQKFKKIISIVAATLSVAAIVGLAVFLVSNDVTDDKKKKKSIKETTKLLQTEVTDETKTIPPSENEETTTEAKKITSSENKETTTEEETTKPAETTKPKYTVTKLDKTMYAKSTVNVRKGPSTDFEKVISLSTGKQVKVVGQSEQTGWYLIQFDGKEGYVSDSYLQDKPVETTTPKPTTTKAPSTSSGKTETTTKKPSSDDDLSPEELAAKYNPNWWKHDRYVIAKNSDGSYDVKNCIFGLPAHWEEDLNCGVSSSQMNREVSTIIQTELDRMNLLEIPEGYYLTIGIIPQYNNIEYSHFDIRDFELGIRTDDKSKDSWYWYYDENFNLQKKTS